MKKEFGMGVASVFEKVKKTVQEKWEGFKKKFESAKSEMSQEVLSAKTPDDMIATGKKLQEQGEVLKTEEEGVKKEEVDEARDEADIENKSFDERKVKEKMETEHGEAIEMNKEFDEAKIAEEKAKEKAELAEDARLSAEADAAKAAELLEKIKSGKLESVPAEKGEAVKVENVEQIKTPEESQYEFFKGTLEYDEDGKMNSIFNILRDNPIVMLEAYKKNPENLHWVSKRLSKDPEFVKQMETLGAGTRKDGTLGGDRNSPGEFSAVDTNKKPTQENFEKVRLKAVAFNLARGSRSLEEMGVDKDLARAAIKDGILKSLNYFGNGNIFDNQEQIKKATEAIGVDMKEIISDPDVRKEIVENAIPRMCSYIAGDRSSFELIDKLLNNLSKTFNVTKSEWEKAAQSPWGGNNVHSYLDSRARGF